jgi:carbonic anhydrase/acetyltransferase-like protein (isoleucine patch superfamily)
VIRPYKGILPKIDPSAFIDESAQIIGDVEIGAESSVWMTCVVRGDVNVIRIGRRTNIQDGTIVHVMRDTHATRLADEVTVGHGVILHGCTVDARCLIGMGAILLNGVTVGHDSIIAAGALVTEGTLIAPRSLVMGSPAKVRRELTDGEVSTIRDYAERYVKYRLDYMPQAPPSPEGLRRDLAKARRAEAGER